jgi:sugar O-acyltransferase (sialic acid O-acetyltransferase NeuD family)
VRSLVLFGVGSEALIAYHQLSRCPDYRVVGFTVDAAYRSAESLFDLPVAPFEQVADRFPPREHGMHIAVGYSDMNRLRARKCAEARALGYALVTVVDPTAVVYPDVSLGENCLIGPYTVIQHAARIGDNVIIRDHCHIGHDARIQKNGFISSHAVVSGHVTLGPNCFVGSGSVIKEGLTIGKASLIGAGITMLQGSGECEVYMNRAAQKLPFPSDRFRL